MRYDNGTEHGTCQPLWSYRPRRRLALAVAVYRPGQRRWVTVAKLVEVDGELTLAIPYRHRRRLEGRISLPLVALRFAIEQGAKSVVVRFDDEKRALRLGLAEALEVGEHGQVDGQPELWLRLGDFEEAPWPDWPFATESVRLGPGPDQLPRQLTFGLEVGP